MNSGQPENVGHGGVAERLNAAVSKALGGCRAAVAEVLSLCSKNTSDAGSPSLAPVEAADRPSRPETACRQGRVTRASIARARSPRCTPIQTCDTAGIATIGATGYGVARIPSPSSDTFCNTMSENEMDGFEAPGDVAAPEIEIDTATRGQLQRVVAGIVCGLTPEDIQECVTGAAQWPASVVEMLQRPLEPEELDAHVDVLLAALQTPAQTTTS